MQDKTVLRDVFTMGLRNADASESGHEESAERWDGRRFMHRQP